MSDVAREYVKTLELPWRLKSLLFLLSDYHNTRQGCAWPGLSTLAHVTGIDRCNLKRLIRDLVATGALRYEPGRGRGHLGKFYFIELEGKKGPNDTFSDAKGVEKGVEKGVISTHLERKNQKPTTNTLPPSGPCALHPDSGRTLWGGCFECYTLKYSA
jgi:hypothetical protein